MAVNDSQLLIHEEGHFDITEVIARKFRKTLNTKIRYFSDIDTLGTMVNILFDYKEELDSQYDEETTHGINKEKQLEWNKTIQKMLDSLKEYENPNGSITLKN